MCETSYILVHACLFVYIVSFPGSNLSNILCINTLYMQYDSVVEHTDCELMRLLLRTSTGWTIRSTLKNVNWRRPWYDG